ncbi:alanine racemase [Frigoribacterium sp. CFBP 13729]|jgi:alanine racemase|uniref:alanine racemase n=1 Tax=Frigoribacterium sp. CFBP 13729 TaxID=2775293 RepID=UPI00177EDC2E|nr:alanine racemase [Frigoribacterium sp. CFBP 13729]MBD8610900.1 alanine racemase [Frigoribacterium sp. CFBP 13729]
MTAWMRRATIDLAAYRANLTSLIERMAPVEVLAIVKADAYSLGAEVIVPEALAAGIRWFGTVEPQPAYEMRRAGVGDEASFFAWQLGPDEDWDAAVRLRVDLGVSTLEQLESFAAAARAAGPGHEALVHLTIDTGLHREGCLPADWPAFVARAVELRDEGTVRLRGAFSHVSETSEADDHAASLVFRRALEDAEALGATFEKRHMSSSSAGMEHPERRFDMVRMGSNGYGNPVTEGVTAADRGLRPVLTLGARVVRVKRVAAGTGVSYDYTWRAERDTTLALVPLGYADGVSRRAQQRAQVTIHGRRYPIVGRVAMDQFLVDVGDDEVEVGDEVLLFGPGDDGELTIGEWADLTDSIPEEVSCRIGARVPRHYLGRTGGGVDSGATATAPDGTAAGASS